jgi:hypothetical protein
MDNPESKSAPESTPRGSNQPDLSDVSLSGGLRDSEPTIQELRQAYDSLRHLVISVLVLMVVVSGTLNLFLLRQAKYARADLAAIKPQVTQLVADYNKNKAPIIQDFARKLVDFGEKHPDFMPILQKYGITRQSTTGAPPASATSPAPAAAAAPARK